MTTNPTTPDTLILFESVDDHTILALREGLVYYLTPCCNASAKGGEHWVLCRACHTTIPDWMGDCAEATDKLGIARMAGQVTDDGMLPMLIGHLVAAATEDARAVR